MGCKESDPNIKKEKRISNYGTNKKEETPKVTTNLFPIIPKYNSIFLGINIGAFKTVYSTFSLNENKKYIYQVLLMNESSRIIPSIICYSNHRDFGENSKSFLKQNLKTSFNNISRLIGFDNSNEEELKYMYNKEGNMEKIKEIGNKNIIADFLSLINEYYFEKEKIKYDITCLSVPDFYTPNQKQELKLICESIGMKDINIYNESSAITMYYGYSKYRDLFLNENNNVNKTLTKYILFVDIGHSKTSFILSKFEYDLFEVEHIKLIKDIGGRNIDLLLYEYCINEFKKCVDLYENDITDRMKFRVIEEINKKKKNFIISEEIQILVDEYYNGNDLNIIIKKDKFEDVIKEIIEKIEKEFDETLKYIKDKQIEVNSLEIAGEIFRIPTFQEIFKKKGFKDFKLEEEDKKNNLSNIILIDECASVGAALLGSFYEGDFPLKTLKKIENKVTEDKFEYKPDNSLIKEIQKHIEIQKYLDSFYHEFTKNKNNYKDYIYSLRKVNSMSKDNSKKIKDLQRKLQKIEYKEEKDRNELEEINKQIKECGLNIINDLIQELKTENCDDLIEKLEEMKNKNDFPYKELSEFYQNELSSIIDNSNINII